MTAGRIPPANEVRRVVTDYGPDPYALVREELRAGEIASRLQGMGGHIYIGDRGDIPSGQASGADLPSPQAFIGAAPLLARNQVLYTPGHPDIDTAPSEGPYADPVARLLAQRLADA